MHSRPERVADQIRHEVTTLLNRSVQDPGIGFLTITRVKVTADLQLARIFYTTITPEGAELEKTKKETAKALERAKPFLRRQVTQRINLRRSPELEFLYDDSIADLDNVERLLLEVREERRQYELANPPGLEPAEGAEPADAREAAEPTADAPPVAQGDGDGGTADPPAAQGDGDGGTADDGK